MTSDVTLIKFRNLDGDIGYRTHDGFKVARVDGRLRWMVSGPGILTFQRARNLDGVKAVIDYVRTHGSDGRR